jgi:hypothetical protein
MEGSMVQVTLVTRHGGLTSYKRRCAMKWGPWYLRSRTVTLWEVVCPRCGAVANYGYSKLEAIDVAEEDGWIDGLCFECWEREQERVNARWEIPPHQQRTW